MSRTTYRLCHRWMRKLLAAGQPLPTQPPRLAGQEWHAARAALAHREVSA